MFTYTRRVAFAETDLAGIVHFANYCRYMEEAEHAFFRTLGLTLHDRQPDGTVISWPRVRAVCNYLSPAHYDDELQIDLSIARIGAKSLALGFEFRRGETKLATGELTTVCCRLRPGQPMESIAIPEEIRRKFATASQSTREP